MNLPFLFSLLKNQHIRDVDHALALSLYRMETGTPDLVCAAFALSSRAHSLGHSCLPLTKIPELLQQTGGTALSAIPDSAAFHQALQDSHWVGQEHDQNVLAVLDNYSISLKRYWNYEKKLAQLFNARLTAESESISENTEQYWQQLFSADTRSAQALAARRACEEKLFLLTGGPGTGKTAAIARILQMLQYQAREKNQTLRIALAAPTGKAATRLSEALRSELLMFEAKTLHRLLGVRFNSVQFLHDAKHPLLQDVLIVDEASMIDLPMMCKLLEALPPEARLILVGDAQQLPSVETGNVLQALCQTLKHTTDSASRRVHLDRIYRQDSTSDFAQAANTVLAGDAKTFIEDLRQSHYRGLHWHDSSPSNLETIIQNRALPHYQKLQHAASLDQALAISKSFRVLCAARESQAGCIAINRYISEHVNKKNDSPFYAGRLCMVTENTAREQLFNGDIGLCWPDTDGVMRIWVETAAGIKSWHPSHFPKHEDAFAITVHKAQGSEFGRVLLVLPDAQHRVLSRELLYTGLTRARLELEIVASEDSLTKAIARQNVRWSNLARYISRPPLAIGVQSA